MIDKDHNKAFEDVFRGFFVVHKTTRGEWGAFLFYQDLRKGHLLTDVDIHHFNRLAEPRYSDFFDQRSLGALTQRFGVACDGLVQTIKREIQLRSFDAGPSALPN